MTGRPVVPLSQVKKVSFLADKNRFIVTLSLCTKMSFFVLSQSVPREGMHQAVKILSCPIPRPVPNFDRLSLCPAGQENSVPLESLSGTRSSRICFDQLHSDNGTHPINDDDRGAFR